MAGNFSVPSHTTFLAGYLDAVGRHFTDGSRLCAITAAVMPAEFLEGIAITSATPVENIVQEFDRDISQFLNADPRSGLLFYLMDYFDWYKQFSDNCLCEKLRLKGRDLPDDHIAYRLSIDHKHEVLFLGYWNDKGTTPINRLKRSRV